FRSLDSPNFILLEARLFLDNNLQVNSIGLSSGFNNFYIRKKTRLIQALNSLSYILAGYGNFRTLLQPAGSNNKLLARGGQPFNFYPQHFQLLGSYVHGIFNTK